MQPEIILKILRKKKLNFLRIRNGRKIREIVEVEKGENRMMDYTGI